MENSADIETKRRIECVVRIAIAEAVVGRPRYMSKTLGGPDFADFINIHYWEKHGVAPPHVEIEGWPNESDYDDGINSKRLDNGRAQQASPPSSCGDKQINAATVR